VVVERVEVVRVEVVRVVVERAEVVRGVVPPIQNSIELGMSMRFDHTGAPTKRLEIYLIKPRCCDCRARFGYCSNHDLPAH
jgi:hypothetical protein